jgi:tetratricopeptide (TPR) repeat protein
MSTPANFKGAKPIIDPANAAMLLIDHQSGLFQTIQDMPFTEVRTNATILAKVASLAKIPVITSASVPQGPNGPLIPEIHKYAPHAQYVARRGEINAWDNPEFVAAVKATGKNQLTVLLYPLGDHERAFTYLREADGLARLLDDQRRLGQLAVYLCLYYWQTGHPREAVGYGQSALAMAESLRDVPLQVTGSLHLSAAYLAMGDFRRAEALLLRVRQCLEGDRIRERFGHAAFPAVSARFYLTLAASQQGRFEDGIAHGQEGIRLAEALDHPYSLSAMCLILALLQTARGELGHAVPLLERSAVLAREWNLTQQSAMGWALLGYAYALLGRVAEGIPMLERALKAHETMAVGAFQPTVLIYLGEAYVLADRLEDALAIARRALTFVRERGHRPNEARALQLLGDVTARGDSPEDADGHYRAALALAVELGMRPLAAHCHLGLGRLYRRTGKGREAQEHVTTAIAMYREMGMHLWRERAEAEMLDSPRLSSRTAPSSW